MLSSPQNPSLADRLAALRARIAAAATAAGRDAADILLLAVSKTQPEARIREAADLGLRSFGENYVTEAVAKISQLEPLGLEWHFIGRLQANKTRPVAMHFDWVHGVDRIALARRLSEQRGHFAPPLNLCLQVNVLGEASKGGVTPAELPALIDAVMELPRLRLRGLMCMLPYAAPQALQREGFGQLRTLRDAAIARGIPLDTLSMGMSDDLEAAVAEGATILRIGSALFGARATAG
mgnify:CR=1 FL=1